MAKKVGRNQPCPCGSGLKYKYCCIANERKVRKVQTNTSCEKCGTNLDADLTNDLLNIVASAEVPLKNFCKDNDIYFFGLCVTLADMETLGEKLRLGELSKKDIIDVYKSKATRDALRGYINDGARLHSAFSDREKILNDAIDAHFEGKYTLSVPVLFAQLEGILRELGGLSGADKFRPTVSHDIWDSRLLFTLTDNSAYFNQFITRLYEGGAGPSSFNRNPILHGMNVSYHSEEWSLILALAVVEIRTFLWFEKHTEPFF